MEGKTMTREDRIRIDNPQEYESMVAEAQILARKSIVLANVFASRFAEGTPEKNIEEIQRSPEEYVYLFSATTDFLSDLVQLLNRLEA